VLAVLRRRDFAMLWFAGLISMIGDGMLAVALPIAVYHLTGSALATGGVLIANKLSALALGSFAGVFVDRWDRQRTMVTANVIRALLLLPLLAVNSADRIWIVYVIAAALSAVGQFFRPAENALLPLLVDRDQLVPANSLNALGANLSGLVGPALGGVTAAWIGLGGVAAVDSVSYVIALVMIAAIALPAQRERATTQGSPREKARSLGRDWLEGLRSVSGNPTLRVVFTAFALASLGEGVWQTAFWGYVDQALEGGAPEAGWLLSAQAVGGLIGATLIGARARNRHPLALLGWGSMGLGLIDLALFNYPAFVGGIGLGLGLMAVVGLPATAFGTGYTTLLQTESADENRGRVFGALLAVSALFMIAGAVFAGFAMERFSAVTVLTFDGLGYVFAGLYALRALMSGGARQPVTPTVERLVTP